jgi:hypothetical protein
MLSQQSIAELVSAHSGEGLLPRHNCTWDHWITSPMNSAITMRKFTSLRKSWEIRFYQGLLKIQAAFVHRIGWGKGRISNNQLRRDRDRKSGNQRIGRYRLVCEAPRVKDNKKQ